jgi:hypothetical protein
MEFRSSLTAIPREAPITTLHRLAPSSKKAFRRSHPRVSGRPFRSMGLSNPGLGFILLNRRHPEEALKWASLNCVIRLNQAPAATKPDREWRPGVK